MNTTSAGIKILGVKRAEHATHEGDATGLTAVKTQRPISSDDEHVVLKFRPRTSAQPPGKRLQSVQLLSGGEKAMTAVALVFAIFRLNPAPFCLLDEVDAPLDEANVGRFTAMVSEMSEQVQFLFVTHNKATMEAAHQLSGVTMREPGVSRLVSVDLAEAARLAGAA